MNILEWHGGPPPHIGWWNASWIRQQDCWRWWDGKQWSLAAPDTATPEEAAAIARKSSRLSLIEIEWRWHYPENARVPRIDPRSIK